MDPSSLSLYVAITSLAVGRTRTVIFSQVLEQNCKSNAHKTGLTHLDEKSNEGI